MLWMALRTLAARRALTLLAGTGLLTATLGFLVLATTAQTTQAELTGNIERAWTTPYDLLVRPPDSVTALERSQELVRPNFMSGINGGITLAQLDAIRDVPGVALAAPVAVAGVVNWSVGALRLTPEDLHFTAPLAVYRITVTSLAQDSLSHYPLDQRYLIAARDGQLDVTSQVAVLHVGSSTISCSYPVSCYAPTICTRQACLPVPSSAAYDLPIEQPIVIAGIDPPAEAQLAGLDHCVVSGRALRADDQITTSPATSVVPALPVIPVVASSHSFIDESFTLDVSHASDPSLVFSQLPPSALGGWQPDPAHSVSLDSLYRSYLQVADGSIDAWPVWTVGDVRYAQDTPAAERLTALGQQPLDTSIYQRNIRVVGFPADLLIPPEARDVAFRSVTEHAHISQPGSFDPGTRRWHLLGTYLPDCLTGFNALAGGALETYAPPRVTLPTGHQLAPTRSMADYVNSPPLVLTTLGGARWFADPTRFPGQPGNAFISVIRVKVAGVGTPGPVAEARLSRVAAAIHDATGLQVDIVKGASPKTIEVALPAGNFGRPALTVREEWSVKGVAYRFSRAVSAQNLALFALILVSATLLTGQAAYTAVRRRRTEFGVLRALGWPTSRIAWLVEVEMLALGGVVGVLTMLLGVLLVLIFHLGIAAWQFGLAFPLAIGVAALAALVPAQAAARGTTLSVLTPARRVRRSRVPASPVTLAVRDVWSTWRVEAILGASAVALGAALLGGVVLIAQAFRGQLDTTVLGLYLAAQVQLFHVVLAVLALSIGALAATEIVTLSYLERQPQLAALRALGWPRVRVLEILASQAIALGLAGGGVAGLLVCLGGWLVQAQLGAIVAGAAASCLGALVATVGAVCGPLLSAYRLSPVAALQQE